VGVTVTPTETHRPLTTTAPAADDAVPATPSVTAPSGAVPIDQSMPEYASRAVKIARYVPTLFGWHSTNAE
jgi:hypothetical protein